MSNKPNLAILQYNVWKSREKVMASFLRDKAIEEFDIIAIQEPWKNPYQNTTHNPCSHHFDLVYHDSHEARICTLINKRIPKSKWTAFHHSPDLTTIKIEGVSGRGEDSVQVHNIYNPSPDKGQSA